jgi:hypothetical protein
MSIRTIFTALIRGAGSLALGCTILGYVAAQAGPQGCEAAIHVTEADVHLWVDGESYRVDSWRDAPILWPLRPGRHVLRMLRGGRILYEETFTLGRGEEVVLTAWDPARLRPTNP